MPPTKLLRWVADAAQKLGYTIDRQQDNPPELILTLPGSLATPTGGLKVLVTPEKITTRFYLEDSSYDPINYPGLVDYNIKFRSDRIVPILAEIRRRFIRIKQLHKKIMRYGEKIDSLRQRMKLIGLTDKSRRANDFAENLLPHDSPINFHAADLINDKTTRQQYWRWLHKLRRSNPQLYLQHLQRLQAWESRRNPSNPMAISPPPPVVFPSVMPTTKLHATLAAAVDHSADINSAVTKALPKIPQLRKTRSRIISISQLNPRNYLLTVQLQPRYRSQPVALSDKQIRQTVRRLHVLTNIRFRFRQLIISQHPTVSLLAEMPRNKLSPVPKSAKKTKVTPKDNW